MTTATTNSQKRKIRHCPAPYTFRAVQSAILHHIASGKSLRRIAAEDYRGQVTHAAVARIARGIEPRDPPTRLAFGLSALALAPVCLHCGEVHTTKRCTAGTQPTPRVKHICENCAHWIHADGQAHGDCQNDGMMNMVGPHLWTTPGFGCILWKKRAESAIEY